MMNSDFHIHTEYCGHAPGMTVERICRRAEELRLQQIAITDHIYDNDSAWVVQQVRDDLQAAAPSIPVIVGAEVDVDWEFVDGRLASDQIDGIDYIIAGFHYVPTIGNYPWKPEQCGLDSPTFMRLWESTLLGVVSNPAIHTLAHPGRLFAAAMGLAGDWDAAMEVFKKAAALSAKNRIAWEVNELTGRRLAPEFKEKWHRIYEIALDAGLKLIFGSDAHDVQSIAVGDFSVQILARLGSAQFSTPQDIVEWKKSR